MSVEAFKTKLYELAGIDCDRKSIHMTGNINAKYFIGNGAYLEGIAEAAIPAVINADLMGNVNATGNVIAKYFIGNGAYLEGIAEAAIPAVINADLMGNVNATGNVIAKYFIGNGSKLTDVVASIPTVINADLVGNVNSSGVVNAKSFIGDGSNLTGVFASIPTVINADLMGNVNATGDMNAKYFIGNGAYLEGITEASIPTVINADLVGNVNATGDVNAKSFLGDGSKLTGVKVEIPTDVTFDNVDVKKSILIGQNSKKILNIQKGVVESKGSISQNYELLKYKFPSNSFVSNNVIVFTSVVSDIDVEIDKHFIVAKNYGYNETYNLVYIQARDLLGYISAPYSINVLAIEYS